MTPKTTTCCAILLACLGAAAADAKVAVLAIDPVTPTTIYAGTAYPDLSPIGVYRSTDGGTTWAATSLTGASVYALVPDPTTEGTIYAGKGGGVSKSTDGGDAWTDVATWDGAVLDLTLDASTSPATLCATVAFFVADVHFQSDDDGGSWHVVDACPQPDEPTGIMPRYATWSPTATDGGVYKSTDGGGTWLARNVGLDDADVTVLAVDPTTRATLFAGTEHAGVFTSTDGACTWRGVGLGDFMPPRARPVCQGGPDAIGLVCRLDVLADLVRAVSSTTGGAGARLLARSDAARRQLLDVAEPSGASEATSNVLLRRARRELTVFRHVARRVGRRRLIAPPEMVDDILTDLRVLQRVDPTDRVCR
jgi:hypothetical protein